MPTPRTDGGYDYIDNRQRFWAIYPPNMGPTRDVPDGVLPNGPSHKENLWPNASNWRACLREPAYGQKPFVHLVSGKDLDTATKQIEWYADDKAAGGGDNAWILVAALALLMWRE